MKWLIAFVVTLVLFNIGLYGENKFINKYWFPKEVRSFLISHKFADGECISSSRWAVNPKKVLTMKETKYSSVYLLKDLDRHEHYQYIDKMIVDKYAVKSSCRS